MTDAAARLRRKLLYGAVGLLVGLLVAALVSVPVVLAQVRQTQLDGTPTGKKLVESADRILDCTDVRGRCYREGQRRTAEVLASVQRIIILSAACSATVGPGAVEVRVAAISDCVTQRLTSKP